MKDTTVIPEGYYCYKITGKPTADGRLPIESCPYWSADSSKHEQENGYCAFLERGDWESDGISLLWDQVKECGENYGDDEAWGPCAEDVG